MPESIGSRKLTNGSYADGRMNGHGSARRRPAHRSRGLVAYLFSAAARLTIWAVIFTIVFRCPSSPQDCDETSPLICEPYFRAKSLAAPYVQPFYDEQVLPYVDIARPYYDVADTRVLTPLRAYAVEYGAPVVERVRAKALDQWSAHGQAQVSQWRAQWERYYSHRVLPHVLRAVEIGEPYYEIACEYALRLYEIACKCLQLLYHECLVPLFELAQPYALRGYHAAEAFAAEKAVPAVHWTWDRTSAFFERAVWPQVRSVYTRNIEPQLVRIGERLERYKNKTGAGLRSNNVPLGKPRPDDAVLQNTSSKPKPVEPVQPPSQSSFVKPAPQITSVAAAPDAPQEKKSTSGSTGARSERMTDAPWRPVKAQAPGVAEVETEQRKKAREMVSHDLDMWQEKFAAQADEGALAMEEHIDDIAQRMLLEGVSVKGKDLVKKLQLTAESELALLKTRISSLVNKISQDTAADDDDDDDDDQTGKQVVQAVRAAGMAIKHAARAVRDWRESYESELQDLVLDAADVHFQILDETRGLALQQIGMKWAWTDGVSYRDWARYHELKRTLSRWTEELKNLVVTNPALIKAQEASAQVEDEGMAIASRAAAELARLKEVAHYKVLARDASDNFDLEAMRRAAENKVQLVSQPMSGASGSDAVESEFCIWEARTSRPMLSGSIMAEGYSFQSQRPSFDEMTGHEGQKGMPLSSAFESDSVSTEPEPEPEPEAEDANEEDIEVSQDTTDTENADSDGIMDTDGQCATEAEDETIRWGEDPLTSPV